MLTGLSGVASAATVIVNGGTPVSVHLEAPLSSSTAKAGETFRIMAAAPLVASGWVVVRSGAVGQGTVTAASPAGKSGRQGTLSVTFDWIYSASGAKIPLAAIERNQAGKNKTGSSNAANIGATLILGPLGLFAHNFVKGHDVNVATSHMFKAYVGRTVAVGASHMYSSH
ncbi:MAG: hypothetical protein GIW99_07410 [Candidatus Eremiobacteraeota bacterium]|nr:hypothetical protein [Candidatus Eremiobacteraeota bacterium]